MMNNIIWADLNGNFKLAQRNDKFKLGTDSVLLSHFVNIKPKHNIVDLCSGTGAVGFLCYLRYNQNSTIFVDVDNDMIELSKITATKNNVENKFSHLNYDICELNHNIIPNQWADYITVNPPYFKNNTGKINQNSEIIGARHCDEDFLDLLFKKSYSILKDGGKIALVHRCEYLSDICHFMKINKIEPKRIQLVHSYKDKNATLVLIEGMKNASSSLICLSPLILYEKNGICTEEFEKIQKL